MMLMLWRAALRLSEHCSHQLKAQPQSSVLGKCFAWHVLLPHNHLPGLHIVGVG